MFSINHPLLFALAAIVIVFVLGQSFFFFYQAWKEALRLGLKKKMLKRLVLSTAVFTLAPALAILLGLLSLSKFLGLPLPWLRLSVLGALTYELPAAASVANIMNLSLDQPLQNAVAFNAMAWVMTLGILSGILVILFFQKSMASGLRKVRAKDEAWSKVLMDSLFIGMISAFLGMVFSDVGSGLAGMIPVFVLVFSALLMIFWGFLIKRYKWKWLESYALPLSMLGAMAFAIPLTYWLI
ncbi:MAG TPA: DUF5058 family protein [Clostridia bacterium]|nr:DUF5058 family protein [Clostridia bacterium]